MVEQRKYGIVVAENDQGHLRVIRDNFELTGATIQQTGTGIYQVGSWNVPVQIPATWGNLGNLVRVIHDIDLWMVDEKRKAVSLVRDRLGSIDLVVMNRSKIHSPRDYDGFEAAREIRAAGYLGHICVQSLFLHEADKQTAVDSGVDELVLKGSLDSFFGYLAERYSEVRDSS